MIIKSQRDDIVIEQEINKSRRDDIIIEQKNEQNKKPQRGDIIKSYICLAHSPPLPRDFIAWKYKEGRFWRLVDGLPHNEIVR